MRGLNVFIQDIRNAPSKVHEQKRVDKELANIRKKFRNTDLSSYDKKKWAKPLNPLVTEPQHGGGYGAATRARSNPPPRRLRSMQP